MLAPSKPRSRNTRAAASRMRGWTSQARSLVGRPVRGASVLAGFILSPHPGTLSAPLRLNREIVEAGPTVNRTLPFRSDIEIARGLAMSSRLGALSDRSGDDAAGELFRPRLPRGRGLANVTAQAAASERARPARSAAAASRA